MLEQQININKGIITLTNHLNTSAIEDEIKERRKDSDNGWTEGRTGRELAHIPKELFTFEKELRDYRELLAMGLEAQAKQKLLKWLSRHPQYMAVESINTGRTRFL